MGLAVTVHEDTEDACRTALELLSAVMEMTIVLRPTQMPGTRRWIGRAIHQAAPTPQAAGR